MSDVARDVSGQTLKGELMDAQDTALAAELDRRLNILQTEEKGDPAHAPLSSVDMWIAIVAIAVTTVIGLVVLI